MKLAPHKSSIPSRTARRLFLWRLLVATEVLVAILLIEFIVQNLFFAKPSVALIRKSSVTFTPLPGLPHFYEPRANSENSEAPNTWALPPFTTKINSDTLVADHEFSKEKPADVFRIVVLGDSFVYGLYVNNKDNYAQKLEGLLNETLRCTPQRHFEVINSGERGYDIAYAAAHFARHAALYHPDLVVWHIKSDDFNVPTEYVYKEVEQMVGRDLGDAQTDLDPISIAAVKKVLTYDPAFILSYGLKGLSSITPAYGGDLLLYAPTSELSIPVYGETLETFAAKRPHTVIYYSPITITKDDIFPDNHFNVAGHEKVAKDLFAYLLPSLKTRGCEQK